MKGCVVGKNNIDEINTSAKIIYTKIVVISQAHRRTKIELDNNFIPSLLNKTIIIIINSDDNYEKNGRLRDKTNGTIYKIKFSEEEQILNSPMKISTDIFVLDENVLGCTKEKVHYVQHITKLYLD